MRCQQAGTRPRSGRRTRLLLASLLTVRRGTVLLFGSKSRRHRVVADTRSPQILARPPHRRTGAANLPAGQSQTGRHTLSKLLHHLRRRLSCFR